MPRESESSYVLSRAGSRQAQLDTPRLSARRPSAGGSPFKPLRAATSVGRVFHARWRQTGFVYRAVDLSCGSERDCRAIGGRPTRSVPRVKHLCHTGG